MVPNRKQVEKECGFRTILHAYKMIVSTSPHLSLLQLNDLESQVSSKLYKLCRSWVNNIVTNKAFSPPDFLPAPNVEAKFQYDKEWLEKNALTVCVNQETYDALTKKVHEFDLEEKHSGPKNDGTEYQEIGQTNDTAMEAAREKSVDQVEETNGGLRIDDSQHEKTGENKDTMMEASNEKSTVDGVVENNSGSRIDESQHQEISQTNDTMMEFPASDKNVNLPGGLRMDESQQQEISQTNDTMMELPASDENVNLPTTVVTQDMTVTNDAEHLKDINGELRDNGVVEDDCVTSTAVAKAISNEHSMTNETKIWNDSFADDLVDTEEQFYARTRV
jgi:hypothetical protein